MINKLNLFFLQKFLAVAGYSIFLYKAFEVYKLTSNLNPTLIALIIGEAITIIILIIAKPAKDYEFGFISAVSTVVATFYFLVIFLGGGIEFIDPQIAVWGQAIAIVFQIISKIALGRSFGLMPANRGIVTRGPYKIVRHPIYLGYFLNHIFYLLSNFSTHNLIMYLILFFFQGVRIWREEIVLKRDSEYGNYMLKTKYRIIPGVF